MAGAKVTLRAPSSTWSATTQTDSEGEFQFARVAAGDYTLSVLLSRASSPAAVHHHPGFRQASSSPFRFVLAANRQWVEVSGEESRLKTQSSTLDHRFRAEIAHTAGADQTNSMAMITDFTPAAYLVHDMLHLRDGHQDDWFFDESIPVINTNIAVNVPPSINPKNVESLEVERGGYSAEYGDRTYGVFNVVTPSAISSGITRASWRPPTATSIPPTT